MSLDQDDSDTEGREETFRITHNKEQTQSSDEETFRRVFVTGQRPIWRGYRALLVQGACQEGASGAVWLVNDRSQPRCCGEELQIQRGQGLKECRAEIQFVGRIEHPESHLFMMWALMDRESTTVFRNTSRVKR